MLSTATVTIDRTGTGAGEFVASQGSVDCSSTACTVTLPIGGTTTITPAPATGSVFERWAAGGACDAFPSGCQLTVDDDVSLSAAFKLGRATVTVEKTGDGVARITSSPPGIDCGVTCTGEFDYGAMVTLTAEMTAGSTFQGWSGPCTGTGDCTVAAENVKATAALSCDATGTQTLDYTGALQTVTLPACATKVTIDASGAQGGELGGLGARIKGTFTVPGNTTLTVLVGASGGGNGSNGGGGGGSFVYIQSNTADPLIAAGGGGGRSTNSNCTSGPGSATQVPTNSTLGAGNGAGGTGTNGGAQGNPCTLGQPTCGTPGTGAGGGGWTGNGANGTSATPPGGGIAARNGGAGGAAGTNGMAGGYGGGGGSSGSSGASGGGGGYAGGGGGHGWSGSAWGCGGGGGSFNGGDAATQTNTAGARAGNGQVIISW